MTASVVDPLVMVGPDERVDATVVRAFERGEITLRSAYPDLCPPVRSPSVRARCPLYPCPTDSSFVAETEPELVALFEQHRAEVHREDAPR